jgi:hypothetical protein
MHADSVDKLWRGIVTKNAWKYACFDKQSWLMFNLNEDPYEQVNLAHNPRLKTERKQLLDRLGAWVRDTGDRFGVPETWLSALSTHPCVFRQSTDFSW